MTNISGLTATELMNVLEQKDITLFNQINNLFKGDYLKEYNERWNYKFEMFDRIADKLRWLKPTLWLTECNENRDAFGAYFAKNHPNSTISSTYVYCDIMIGISDITDEQWGYLNELFTFLFGDKPNDLDGTPDETYWRTSVNEYEFVDFLRKLQYIDSMISTHIANYHYIIN